MKFQAVIAAVFIATVYLVGNVEALGVGPVGPPSFCPIHSSILISEASKVDTPDLPEDLKIRLDEVVVNAAEGCAACDGLIIWQNRICVITNLKTSLLQIQQIQAEADARAAAAPEQ